MGSQLVFRRKRAKNGVRCLRVSLWASRVVPALRPACGDRGGASRPVRWDADTPRGDAARALGLEGLTGVSQSCMVQNSSASDFHFKQIT